MGNAVNTASTTVNSGTSEMTVVNVRLLAVLPSRSSRNRSSSVRPVARQGKVFRVPSKASSFMAAIMPAKCLHPCPLTNPMLP